MLGDDKSLSQTVSSRSDEGPSLETSANIFTFSSSPLAVTAVRIVLLLVDMSKILTKERYSNCLIYSVSLKTNKNFHKAVRHEVKLTTTP